MAKKKHALDVVAEQLEARAAKPHAKQELSPDYWEFYYSVENYPQVVLCKPNVIDKWGDLEGLGEDGFPAIAIPEMKLKGKGRQTDVLTAGLPASWSVGRLFNETALALFKKFELGEFREYPVTVRDSKGVPQTLTYLLIRNEIPGMSVDFVRLSAEGPAYSTTNEQPFVRHDCQAGDTGTLDRVFQPRGDVHCDSQPQLEEVNRRQMVLM